MTNFEYKAKRKEALEKAEDRKQKLELNEINQQYRNVSRWTTSKYLMLFILLNCTAVEIYSMWLMVYLSDLSPLTTLMGSVITESISYAIYCTKSFKENKEKALVQLDRDKFEAGVVAEEDEEIYESSNEEVSNADVSDEDYGNISPIASDDQ